MWQIAVIVGYMIINFLLGVAWVGKSIEVTWSTVVLQTLWYGFILWTLSLAFS